VSIKVGCGCGKRLTVKDELIGKRIKCPQCGAVFVADPSEALETAPAPVPFPTSRRTAVPNANEKSPRFYVSPRMLILGAIAVILPTIFFIWNIGPARVRSEFATRLPVAQNDINDVVDRVLQSYLSHTGEYDPRHPTKIPHAMDVTFVQSPLYFSMPDSIGFAGTSTHGIFHGLYFFQTREVQVEVESNGVTLPSGIVVQRGSEVLHCTGRNNGQTLTAEIDGKPAEIQLNRFATE